MNKMYLNIKNVCINENINTLTKEENIEIKREI